MSLEDQQALQAQLGRSPRSTPKVVRRCDLGLPIVVEMPAQLDNGEPFPTRYWLSCPLACKRIARLEGQGGVAHANHRLNSDADFAKHFSQRNTELKHASLVSDANRTREVSKLGVGGTSTSVKCLHAHFADYAAGHDNRVGAWLAPDVEPLRCSIPCVHLVAGRAERNPEWTEPSQSSDRTASRQNLASPSESDRLTP